MLFFFYQFFLNFHNLSTSKFREFFELLFLLIEKLKSFRMIYVSPSFFGVRIFRFAIILLIDCVIGNPLSRETVTDIRNRFYPERICYRILLKRISKYEYPSLNTRIMVFFFLFQSIRYIFYHWRRICVIYVTSRSRIVNWPQPVVFYTSIVQTMTRCVVSWFRRIQKITSGEI